MLEIWIREIQQKIARLDHAFKAYIDHLANNQTNLIFNNYNNYVSILDEDEDTGDLVSQKSRNIINQLQGVEAQLNHLLNLIDIGIPEQHITETPVIPETPVTTATTNTLSDLLGTLKAILPVRQMVAMWFQTEMLTDPESIYYSPNFGPNAWLDYNPIVSSYNTVDSTIKDNSI